MQKTNNSLRRVFLGFFLVFGILLGMAAPTLAFDAKPISGVVNINTATLDELQILPGIGESRAKLILEERTRRGGFKSVDDLLVIKGIGEKSLEALKPHLVLEGKTTAKRE